MGRILRFLNHNRKWHGGTMMRGVSIGCCLLAALTGGVCAAEDDVRQIEFFEKQVRPVLVERCQECHNEDDAESELRLDSLAGFLEGGARGPAIVPGDPKKSLLVSAVNHSDQLHMPEKEKLPRKEIAALTQWIKMGAFWPNSKPVNPTRKKTRKTGPLFTEKEKNFWAFQRPVKPAQPSVTRSEWVRSPIDAFVLAKLDAAGYAPAPQADKRTLIRRATFDLTGLPPTPEEVVEFLADESADAFARVVDRLLASERYGERYGRHWLDVARYADSNGLDENLAYASAFRYRDYVVSAFNKDKPYDRFVQEQLAGDLLTAQADVASQIEGITATGFLSIGAKMLAEDDPVKMQMDIIDEQIDTLGRAFMGLTLGCVRCHEHKYDPIPIEDYYSLAGIFKSTKTMENFNVVARWQERPLESRAAIAKRDAHQQKIAGKTAEIERLVNDANKRLLATERDHVAEYLLAAEELRRIDALVAKSKSVGADAASKTLPGAVLVEAENFTRGNVTKHFTGYGEGIGVILNKGELPNFAEYDLELRQGGLYQVEIRYAAAAARPTKMIVNGELVKADAAGEVTGSWNPDTQRWMLQGLFPFRGGKNTVRLECAGPFPHFDKLLVLPVPGAGVRPAHPSDGSGAFDPKREIVRQWVQYLEQAKSDSDSVFTAWNRLTEKGDAPNKRTGQLREIAASLGKTFADVDRQWQAFRKTEAGRDAAGLPDADQEALRRVLYDEKGPFALPKKPEAYYTKETRTALEQLREQRTKLEASLPKFPEAMAVSEGEPQNLRIHLRGSHTTLGEQVPRRFLQVLAGEEQTPIDDRRSGRLELARWMTNPEHPLTPRVMANRIWRWHFDEGLVRSPDNFGRLGERPTHPQLLDWLSVRFVEGGWSIKAMHRTIMLSASYQMSTAYNQRAARGDPENRLLWRMNRRRLEAEAVRDSILALAGSLDLTMGGTLLPTANRKYVTSTANVDPVVYTPNRRSIYLPVVRSALYDVFQAFDFADPSVLSGKRASTTVAPQALFMMNSELVSAQTKALAARLLADANLDDTQRLRQLFELSYARPATQAETERALDYVTRYAAGQQARKQSAEESRLRAWQSLCRVVIASNEFVYVE